MESNLRKEMLTNDTMLACYNAAVDYVSVSMNFKKPDDIDPEFKVLTTRCLCCRGINSTENKPYDEVIHAKSLVHISHKHGIPHLTLLTRQFLDRIYVLLGDKEESTVADIPSFNVTRKQVEAMIDDKFIIQLDRSIRQFLSIDYNGINDIDTNLLSDKYLINCLYYLHAMDRTYGNPVYYSQFLIGDVSPARMKRLKAIDRNIVEEIEALRKSEHQSLFSGFLYDMTSNDVERYVIA